MSDISIETQVNPELIPRVLVQMKLTFTFRSQADADRIYDSVHDSFAFPIKNYGDALEQAADQLETDFGVLLGIEKESKG